MKYDQQRALQLLRQGCGKAGAQFHEGQEQAIRHIVEGGGRALVVQRTGWGKSFVYFIAAKLLREGGAGDDAPLHRIRQVMTRVEFGREDGLDVCTLAKARPGRG